MTENQPALKIVVFLDYFNDGYRKGRVFLDVAPCRQELAEPAFDISWGGSALLWLEEFAVFSPVSSKAPVIPTLLTHLS